MGGTERRRGGDIGGDTGGDIGGADIGGTERRRGGDIGGADVRGRWGRVNFGGCGGAGCGAPQYG